MKRCVSVACRRVLFSFVLGPVILMGCPFSGFILLHMSLMMYVCLSCHVCHRAVDGWAASVCIASVTGCFPLVSPQSFPRTASESYSCYFDTCRAPV